jgi:DNA-binding FrmR family transcriptional regulator
MKKFINRLHRVRGQIKHIEESVETGIACHELLPQLMAMKGSLDAAIASYLELSLAECASEKEVKKMRPLLKALFKNF